MNDGGDGPLGEAPASVAGVAAPGPLVSEGRLAATAEGTTAASFSAADWALLLGCAGIWGTSYLLIAEAIEALHPGLVTLSRLVLGAGMLALLPRTRAVRVARGDWPRVALLGLTWFAIPQTMFPIAEQSVSSAITGMLNGAMPMFTAAIAAVLLRRAPARRQRQGIAIGLVGVVMMAVPSLGEGGTATGMAMVLFGVISYAVATNIVVPLQHRYGSLAVTARAQAVGVVMTVPYALWGWGESSWQWSSVVAVVVLGVVGTGMAFVVAGSLMGRVGATRGSVVAYLIPVVALVVGVTFRGDDVALLAVAGLAVVLVGAWLTSRAGR